LAGRYSLKFTTIWRCDSMVFPFSVAGR
jgi:hypothetical protein